MPAQSPAPARYGTLTQPTPPKPSELNPELKKYIFQSEAEQKGLASGFDPPAVLLMDEPFSAVDAMTRAILQELVLNIWEKLPITVLFVTHDVDEAVFLSSRIISLGRAPASIKEDVVIDLPYPRDQIQTRGERRFTEMHQQLFSSIFMQEKTAVAGI